MSEPLPQVALPAPEPTAEDEVRLRALQVLEKDSVLRGNPYGDEQCNNCLFYLNTDDKISYCWHPKLRILVGEQWWCQWWEEISAES